jgi:hypothetical protein
MRRALVAVPILFGAVAAFAQSGAQHVAYQNALLARPVPSSAQSFCAGKGAGPGSGGYDACRVTRLFVADLGANRDQGFPPLTDIKYAANQTETNLIMDALTKYGG